MRSGAATGIDHIDAAIVDWFRGKGGLIDLGDHAADVWFPVGPAEFVEIALDTSVGIDRSLDLIASDSNSGEAAVRDAVLAVLAAELSETAKPIAEVATSHGLSTTVIPTTALVATGWALSRQRRRHQLGEMQKSS